MPYAARLHRFNILATLIGGESLVHTVWLQQDQIDTNPAGALQDMTNKVRDEWANTLNGPAGGPINLKQNLASTTLFTTVKGYSVNSLGQATLQAEAPFAPNLVGIGGNGLPPQDSVCVTLLTAVPGRSGRGRLYLGQMAVNTLTTQGRLVDTARDNIAAAMAGFYTRVRSIPGYPDQWRPVVASPKLGTANKIIKVTVGDVVDTMRSRRNTLNETRSSGTVDSA
jgi:hypothetical protein